MYERTNWKDEVKDQSGNTLQEGTLQSAGHFNNIEDGIVDNAMTISLMITHLLSLEKIVKNEIHTVELKNTDKFPFSNAEATVPLDVTRVDNNYNVDVEIVEKNGSVGSVEIYDKLANAFKVKYFGPAKSAKLKLKVTGGNM